jgi:acetylornithine deacetylase/succinyl-diaminopimelate desuccinylase-like protein
MMKEVAQYLEANADRFVEDLKALLRIPSVSADSAYRKDVRRAADFVKQQLAQAGLETEIHETEGNPIVCASWQGAEGQPTALVYGHYDVKPPDPLDEWQTPPFEPDVRDGKIFARGATDDKGQMLTHIKSVEAWMKQHGKLPINVKFLIEGEEEIGGDNLDIFLNKHKEQLACDVVVVSDTSQYAPGQPAITYGLRGNFGCEVTLRGPKQDLHSGMFGGSVANPANALARMLAAIHDDQGRVQVPSFYDDVQALTDEERKQFANLPFDEASFLKKLGLREAFGETGFTTLERRWARPTCEINGLLSGYTGEGPKTIVPAKAMAKISCRLVPNQHPDKLLQALHDFLKSKLTPGLKMEFKLNRGGPGLVFATDSPYMQAARKAIEFAFGTPPVMIREGGSIPVVSAFRQILGVDTLLLGWGQDTDNLHSPNEHFTLADFHRGIKASAALWQELKR